jgi:hypothetical protein
MLLLLAVICFWACAFPPGRPTAVEIGMITAEGGAGLRKNFSRCYLPARNTQGVDPILVKSSEGALLVVRSSTKEDKASRHKAS